jgi:large subunit ribosomal protein L24
MAKIKKGDLVQVITGAKQNPAEGKKAGDRGKQGKVLEVQGDRVIVEGVNYVTKHNRVGQSQRGTKTGGIETMEAPIHISNVQVVDPSTKKPTRVGHRVEEQTKDGVKRTVRVRYAKKSGKDL